MVCSTNGTPMTNTELTLDQLRAVSGGRSGRAGDIMAEIRGRRSVADYPLQFRLHVRSISGPGGASSLRAPRRALSFSEFKQNVAGSADPGGDDI